MKTTGTTAKALALAVCIIMGGAALSLPPLHAQEDWKTAFDEVCSKVQGADSLSQQEIEDMLKKSDRILPQIQASSDPGKKVYITRLKRCRGVYEFMLDTKKNAATK